MRPADKAPPVPWLRARLKKGATQQQIADEWFEKSGIRITRQGIDYVITKHKLERPRTRERYDDVLPWKVAKEHSNATPAKRLRTEGKLRHGHDVPEEELRLLEAWKHELIEKGSVVSYDRDEGFTYRLRDENDFDLIDEASLPPVVRKDRREQWEAKQRAEPRFDDPRLQKLMDLPGLTLEERLELVGIVQDKDARDQGQTRARKRA